MLQNPKAGNVLQELKWLNKLDIPLHTQIVLCPGINDGYELEKTLNDLAELKSNIISIAIVPVGITKYRQGETLRDFTADETKKVIGQIEKFNKKIGYSLAVPSDEFYIKAGINFPEDDFYRGYGQLDDGVGTARLLIDDYNRHKSRLPKSLPAPLNITIATGQLACEVMKPIITDLNKIKNLNINLIPVKSGFWGDEITVSGLITGKDLLETLLPMRNELTNLLIPSIMLKKYTDKFLDDLTIKDLQEKLGVNIKIIRNCYSNEELINLILNYNR